MRRTLLYASVAVFVGALGASWITHGTGIVQNDAERNIYIPSELTMPLQLKVAYNGRDIFFRYRWPADRPSIFHDMLKFEDGQWVRKGGSVVGPHPDGMYEDRVTMLVDDGSVPEFARYGGYITVGDGMRFFTNEAPVEEVKAHPYLGQERGQSEVRKYLPETRSDINDWSSFVPEGERAALREAGYFLDLWHWRAHRSNPIGASDDQYIFDHRYGDTGRSSFGTNWDADTKQPLFMFDSDKVDRLALSWDDLAGGRLGFDDIYYLSEDFAVPFDADHAWQEGDVIPRIILRAPDGSAGSIRPHGGPARWADGYWDVTLQRAMDTGSPLDDKAFVEKGTYTIGIAVHRNTTGSRWHYVSMPYSLGLDRSADIAAVRFAGRAPDWDDVEWTEVTLFYPGQVSWDHLKSRQHAGADSMRAGVPVKFRHSEVQLAHYGVEAEFRNEIRSQWMLSLFAGILLIFGFGFALNKLIKRPEGV